MEIINLQKKYLFFDLYSGSSFVFRLMQLKDIWVLNSFESCQHVLTSKKIKVSQIKKIVVTGNHIENLAGLLGLLSTLSLNTNISRIDIYGGPGLEKYILLGRKYSYTNFRYKLYVHTAFTASFYQQTDFNICSYISCNHIYYSLIFCERLAAFNVELAINFNIPFGSLFGSLKSGKNFILPDGFIFYSDSFVSGYYLGSKIILINKNANKNTIKMINNATYLLYY